MKFYIRRAMFAVVTAPFALGAYAVLYFGLAFLFGNFGAGLEQFLNNLSMVAGVYIIAIVFLPSINRYIDAMTKDLD